MLSRGAGLETRTDGGRRFEFWLTIALIAMAASWIIFSYFVVPSIIRSAYRGESLSFLNAIISGQAIHPVENYVETWQAIQWRLLSTLCGIGIMAALFGAFSHRKTRMPLGIRMFFAADVFLGLMYVLWITILPPSWFITMFIDLNAEANLPTWYSSTKLFLIAVLLFVFGFGELGTTKRRKWVLLSAAVLFSILSLDETARIHEWLSHQIIPVLFSSGNQASLLFPKTGIVMFFAVPVFLGVIFLIGRSARELLRDRGPLVTKYVLGIVIFVGSAGGIEIVYNFVSEGEIAYFTQVFCEELGEMVGATILLWATWDLLVSHGLSMSRER